MPEGTLPEFFGTPFGSELVMATRTLRELQQALQMRGWSEETVTSGGNAFCWLREIQARRQRQGLDPLGRNRLVDAIGRAGGYQAASQFRYLDGPATVDGNGVQTIRPAIEFNLGSESAPTLSRALAGHSLADWTRRNQHSDLSED